MALCVAITGVLIALSAPVDAKQSTKSEIVGTASVIDGDTIEIHGQRIRLHGIDAPESSQLCSKLNGDRYRCGQNAALQLSDLINRSTVRCQGKAHDRYGRIVAVCALDKAAPAGTSSRTEQIDINEWLVRNGWAVAYRKYSSDYLSAEADAQRQKAGIWQGKFDLPWDWRRAGKEARNPPLQNRTSPKPARNETALQCSGKRYCGQMTSCEEAYFYLNQCGVHRLDGDRDGYLARRSVTDVLQRCCVFLMSSIARASACSLPD
ncbi:MULTISPECIES: thermonuclease family protein [Leptolyngbya]|nr:MULTISPECIES: thermonuclease family protein [Leptolyngbya]MBD2372841.1 thermonuclease family protein [Leptolyngbya sp. FACHB-238]MBD2397406.1 thermonuclease family protein [Leptolyngbya sp. FACHB-239]MBD2403789.1 thermonuclease family protein [Leptolyngbya sp. FACHB-402]ULP33445.1 thermonuclease family protein [Leptolyngbya boryana IU 594]